MKQTRPLVVALCLFSGFFSSFVGAQTDPIDAHLRQDKHGFPLITCRYAAMGSPSCWLASQR